MNTISVANAAKRLNVSRNRIYQLIKQDVIKLHNGIPTIVSVDSYAVNRKPKGRPVGSYKKRG